MKLSKTGIILSFSYTFLGLFYYYFRNIIPLEFVQEWPRRLIVLFFLFTPLLFGLSILSILPEKIQDNKAFGCGISILLFTFIVHNLILTILLLDFRGSYETKEVYYPELNDKKHKILVQYMDEGALGGHFRKIEVYEITPFLNYIIKNDFLN